MSDTRLNINLESLSILSRVWPFKIHGDFTVTTPESLAGLTGWDLEFRNVYLAANFAQTILGEVVDVNIRQGDSVSDLDGAVTLTIICPDS